MNVKRTMEEGSSWAMDTTEEQFVIGYRKRPKINLVTK